MMGTGELNKFHNYKKMDTSHKMWPIWVFQVSHESKRKCWSGSVCKYSFVRDLNLKLLFALLAETQNIVYLDRLSWAVIPTLREGACLFSVALLTNFLFVFQLQCSYRDFHSSLWWKWDLLRLHLPPGSRWRKSCVQPQSQQQHNLYSQRRARHQWSLGQCPGCLQWAGKAGGR